MLLHLSCSLCGGCIYSLYADATVVLARSVLSLSVCRVVWRLSWNNCAFVGHHHHISVMELGHLLTRSGLTYPEVSSKACHDSFCQLENSVLLLWIIYYEAFYVFTCCIQFLLYSSNLSKIGVIFNSFVICLLVLQSVQVYPAFLLIYFMSAAVVLLASLALIVQVSLPYNKTERLVIGQNNKRCAIRVLK